MTLHPQAAGLYALADPAWRGKVFRSGLMLMIPVLGWPGLLGYRASLVRHLLDGAPEALPSWQGRWLRNVFEGLKAMGVIFGYLLPLYAVVAATVLSRGFVPDVRTAWVAAFFVVFPIFSTLSFPVACLLLAMAEPRAWLGPGEVAACLAAFAVPIFLLPAGFLQVSVTGRYRSAFALGRTLPFVCRHFRAYVAAWWHASWMSLVGHLAVPFSPWGVAWAYTAIVFLFNEVLLAERTVPARGWLPRALADPRLAGPGRLGLAWVVDASGAEARVLNLGAFSVPLPTRGRPPSGP